jgi:hypothetical protein
MYAQVIQGGAALEQRDAMDRIVHEQMIPALTEEPGFTGALNLVDRETGNASRRHLERQPRADVGLARQRSGLAVAGERGLGG